MNIPSPSDYGISPTHGFLSADPPLDDFPDPYFQHWDSLIAELPSLIKSQTLKDQIDALPTLDTARLRSELEYRRAYVVLGFIIHAYVWHEDPPNPVVPPQLAQPFLAVCEHFGLQPVLSYIGLCTWNWRLTESYNGDDGDSNVPGQAMDIDNMRTLASFTGTRGEAAFYHVPVLIEYAGERLMHVLLDAVRAGENDDRDVVERGLRETREALDRMSAQLGKLYSRLDASFFYRQHRPFMAGGKGMEDKGLPRGMVMQRTDGNEVECKLVGGSAVQSSLFPFLDSVLGVEHIDDTLFREMRAYMPRAHRDFLERVAEIPSLRRYVEHNAADFRLRDAFDACIDQLRSWRGKHMALVSRYVVQPAREAEREARVMRLEMPGAVGKDEEWELQGTGGSALMPFLKQARDDTLRIEI